ncbi:Transforming growth factor beta-1-induced transcript 1 protein [Bonamia ostreae]|uniref:Transforming growth factor beta-1-induced transcript 1 protein n=1 Tax=Bonamia ostreae TaxID=126728 RepID=A0ABV2AJC1_9EUKA
METLPFRAKGIKSLLDQNNIEIVKPGNEYTVKGITDTKWRINNCNNFYWVDKSYLEFYKKMVQIGPGNRNFFEKFCIFCDRPIESKYLIAAGENFHKECAECSECKKDLREKVFRKINGIVYCDQCDLLHNGPNCASCGGIITSQYLKALGKSWHENHFVCYKCSEPLKREFGLVEEKPICTKCQYEDTPKCKICEEMSSMRINGENFCEKHGKEKEEGKPFCFVCKKDINGKYLKVSQKDIHPQCLKCSKCSADLFGKLYKEKSGKIY